MRDFLRSEQGAVAVVFAVMAVPFIALGGWSVDHIRLQNVKGYLQTQADIAALNAHVENAPEGQWRDIMVSEMARQYPTDWARNLHVEGAMLAGSKDFRVYAEADVPLAFMKLLPGIGDTQKVAVQAVARLMEPEEIYQPPTFAELNPDAGDYNRIWLYCYWPDRVDLNDPERPFRTQMVPIADNGGSDFAFSPPVPPTGQPEDYELMLDWQQVLDTHAYGLDGREQGIWRLEPGSDPREYHYFMPRCPSGSYMSYRLENVRFARTLPQYWDSGAPVNHGGDGHTGRFDYYTDTITSTYGPEEYDGLIHPGMGTQVDMLETVLCETEQECRPVSEGGIIPEGSNRIPQKASEGCSSGKYMYYGWEDRPPGVSGPSGSWQDYAWTDRSYDDIRIVIQCPELHLDGDRNVRLVG